MEKTDFLILIQQDNGIVMKFKGEFYIAQWWFLSNSNRLEDWNFQSIPDIDGIFVVSAEINHEREGILEIRHEQWRLANATDVRSFDVNFADVEEV